MTRGQGNWGKKIDQKDTMLMKSYGTMRWTDKKIGKEMSKHGPMYFISMNIASKNLTIRGFMLLLNHLTT